MRMKDILQLQIWLRAGASFDEVMHASRFGLVDNERFTEKARKHFLFLWLWGAARCDKKHDDVYATLGAAAYWRRIERVRRIIEKIKSS